MPGAGLPAESAPNKHDVWVLSGTLLFLGPTLQDLPRCCLPSPLWQVSSHALGAGRSHSDWGHTVLEMPLTGNLPPATCGPWLGEAFASRGHPPPCSLAHAPLFFSGATRPGLLTFVLNLNGESPFLLITDFMLVDLDLLYNC